MFVSHFENKIKEATTAKTQGTDHFKANRYQQAIKDYEKGLQLVQPHLYYGASQSQFARSAELRATLIFNIGLCHFNQKNLRLAEQRFSQAIDLNPQYLKAIYKRALTRQQREDYEGAMADIKQVCEIDSGNRDFRQSYDRISDKCSTFMNKDKDNKKKTIERKTIEVNKQPKKEPNRQINKEAIRDGNNYNKGANIFWKLGIASIAGIGLYQLLKRQ